MKTFTVYFCVHVITVATKVRLLLIAIYLAYLGVIALWMQAVLNKFGVGSRNGITCGILTNCLFLCLAFLYPN